MIFIRFLIVGGATALFQLSLLTVFLELLRFDYRIATGIAYLLAVIFHFSANRYFTFKQEGAPHKMQIIRYLALVFINLMLTILITFSSVEVFLLGPYVGNALSILATVGIGYLISKGWVFAGRRSHQV